MKDISKRIAELSPAKRALLELEIKTKNKLRELHLAEPIAIIGMSCRFPGGAESPELFAQKLSQGYDAISQIPPERWDIDKYYSPEVGKIGKMYTKEGGFVSKVAEFDAEFFGITPREAESMDPQQRMLLEVTWEALERAGLAMSKLEESQTGVFVGFCSDDYARYHFKSRDMSRIDPYSGSGSLASVAGGRLSYFHALQGPNIVVDTACSSSLVSTHLACQSLHSRECDIAVAGGINLILAPEGHVYFSQIRALSPEGRCKTFDAGANGYVRSEGCGILVLKRLSDAQKAGDRILATIRGSAVNHDGPSSGLTVPNGSSQVQVIRRALKSAKVNPEDIQYLEAHGTGTSLGDPIEVRAISEALCKSRSQEQKLYLGSVKTNIGHCEAAAGVAGLIKSILSLENKVIFPHLHLQDPNPHIPWQELPIKVPDGQIPWESSRSRLVGVSSFGLSGTNAHIILEEAPESPVKHEVPAEPAPYVLPLSAKKPQALEQLQERYQEFLQNSSSELYHICHTAAVRRTHHPVRLAVMGKDRTELMEQLSQAHHGASGTYQTTFVFPEYQQQIHWGKRVFEQEDAFRVAFEKCQGFFSKYSKVSLMEELLDSQEHQGKRQVSLATFFAVEVASAALWRCWGVEPDRVYGIGVGEVAAAHWAGVFDLETACRIVAALDQDSFAQLPELPLKKAKIPFVSALKGEIRDTSYLAAGHWQEANQIQEASQEELALLGAEQQNHTLYLSVAGLSPLLAKAQDKEQLPLGQLLLCYQEATEELTSLRQVLCQFYNCGYEIHWQQVYPHGRCVELPTYPWQKKRYYLEEPESKQERLADTLASYGWEWQQFAPAAHKTINDQELWIIWGNPEQMGQRLADYLQHQSYSHCLITEEQRTTKPYSKILKPLLQQQYSRFHLMYLPELDCSEEEQAIRACQLWQALQQLRGNSEVRIHWHTLGLPWVASSAPESVMASALWGLARVAANEDPASWGGILDLPSSQVDWEKVLPVWQSGQPEQLCLREGKWFRPVLAKRAFEPNQTPRLLKSGAYLITGASGSLGSQLAERLAWQGAGYLVLVGRRQEPENLRNKLERLGSKVEYLQVNLSEPQQVAALREKLQPLAPLKGIFHCAGALDDALLINQTSDKFHRAFAAKANAAWQLHELSHQFSLDYFVLFSSVAGAFGSTGQGNYAAANTVLDALACFRRNQGLPALSIQWGPWQDSEMTAHLKSLPSGWQFLKPETAWELFDQALASKEALRLVADIDWNAFLPGSHSLVRALAEPFAPAEKELAQSEFLEQLGQIPARRQESFLVEFLQQQVAEALGVEVTQVDPEQGLMDLGVDSILAVELHQRLENATQLAVSSTIFLDYPTIEQIARYLLEKILALPASETTPTREPALAVNEPIAVVGMACRLPQGNDPEQFWQVLYQGRDTIVPVPEDRWDWQAFYDPNPDAAGKIYTRHGGFLTVPVADFDARFFGISSNEARNMDPQQRLLLEISWEALENAGYVPQQDLATQTGVFVGIGSSDYTQHLDVTHYEDINAYTGTGIAFSVASGRLSHILGVQGPNLAVDTACSSSLVSVHLACQSLRMGECEMALAGGVNLMLSPEASVYLSRAKALSPDGRCKTFDESANGYVRGEGCAMVVLKRLSDAKRDRDHILGVIRGSAVNHDGTSSGLTVPNSVAQRNLIRRALAFAEVAPEELDYIEAHGTGTSLGDPIEVQSLGEVFQGVSSHKVALGSVKTNIGHLEAAAGVASLVKVLLSLQHEAIPPHLHFQQPSSKIPWEKLPFEVPRQPMTWKKQPNRVRRAGISSFGISGTNAHMVIEEAPELPVATGGETGPELFVLSAKDQQTLQELAWRFALFLEKHPDLSLRQLCYNVSTSRAAFSCRLALPVTAIVELQQKLMLFYQQPEYYTEQMAQSKSQSQRGVFWFFSACPNEPWQLWDHPSFLKHWQEAAQHLPMIAQLQDKPPAELTPVEKQMLALAWQYAAAATCQDWGLAADFVLAKAGGWLAAAVMAGALPLAQAGELVTAAFSPDSSQLPKMCEQITWQTPEIELRGQRALSDPKFWQQAFASSSPVKEQIPEESWGLAFGHSQADLSIQKHSVTFHGQSEKETANEILQALTQAFLAGKKLHWHTIYPEKELRLALPTYPWHKERFWPSTKQAPQADATPGFYQVKWQQQANSNVTPALMPTVIVTGERQEAAITEATATSEAPCYLVVLGKTSQQRDARTWEIASLAELSTVVSELSVPYRVVFAPDLQHSQQAKATTWAECNFQLVELVQTLWNKGHHQWQLYLVTEHAVPLPAQEISPLAASFWGTARVLALENPELWGGAIDLASPADWANCWQEIVCSDGEKQVALRDEQRWVARLAAVEMPAATREFSSQASYLISGGLGEIGLVLAQHLAEKGAGEVILISRRQPSEQQQKLLAEIRNKARVTVVSCDISDYQQVAKLKRTLSRESLPVRGVIHAAGLLSDGFLLQQQPEKFDQVFAPKVVGGDHLVALFASNELDFWVNFSSLASLLGSPGQGNYAAANAALDAWAEKLRTQGIVALSINWGPWQIGMAAQEGGKITSQGVRALTTNESLAALEQALQAQQAQLGFFAANWEKVAREYPTSSHSYLSGLVPASAQQQRPAYQSEIVSQLQQALPGARKRIMLEFLRGMVAELLGFSQKDQVPVDQGLFEMGMDSLSAVDLRRRLEEEFTQTFPSTVVFDYPTCQELAGYLLEQILPEAKPQKATTTVSQLRHDEPIAVVGMSCRFPGNSSDPEAFWELLHQGKDGIVTVPPERWDADEYYDPSPKTPGKMYTRSGGFIEGIEYFDADFFGVAPREAENMDPQQRLLLEVSWEALENAGYDPKALQESRTGVFVGIGSNDYAQNVQSRDKINAYSGTGIAASVAAGRVAYLMGLHGPAISVDTACSSSLVAIHLACQSLRNGECQMAIAGGVNAMISPDTSIYLSKVQALSPDGRCKTFSAQANGYGRGEGSGIIVLKPLSLAKEQQDNILAVIRGSALNHDGPSSGLTVPNGRAQQRLLEEAWARAQVAPHELGYIEAHGTGTPLGDPIELHSLGAMLQKDPKLSEPVWVGSVKTNLGHLEAAAGVAGVMKIILALQHQQIPAHLHCDNPSAQINWEGIPVRIPRQGIEWRTGEKLRKAGISSFGLSGTNAHLVLEEFATGELKPQSAETFRRDQHLLTLSAGSPPALQARAEQVEKLMDHCDWAELCYASNTICSSLGYRLAFTAASSEDGREMLRRHLAQQQFAKKAPRVTPPVAFLFTGQGAQYPGMGRQLYHSEPVFRENLDKCQEILQDSLEQPLLSVLFALEEQQPLVHQTLYTQPALFAFEYSLAQLLISWGIEPGLVMGHSVGEYVAVAIAGVLSLEDALRCIAKRAELMQSLPKNGKMLAVTLSLPELEKYLENTSGISIAAVNAPKSVVVSGEAQAITALQQQLKNEGVRSQPLQVSHAFHSHLMEPILDEFSEFVAQLNFGSLKMPLVSNLTGKLVTQEEISRPEYWREHLRGTVQFYPSLQTAAEEGYQLFVEIGPQPTLTTLGKRCLPKKEITWLATSRKNEEQKYLLNTLAELYQRGFAINWSAVHHTTRRARVHLPSYPWQKKRYWVPRPEEQQTASAFALAEHCYQVEWHAKPLASQQPQEVQYVVLAEQELATNLSSAIEGGIWVQPGERLAHLGEQQWSLPPAQMEKLTEIITTLSSDKPVEILYCWGSGVAAQVPEPVQELQKFCYSLARLAVVAQSLAHPVRIWALTQGAKAVTAGENTSWLASPLAGMAQGVALEFAEIWGGYIDLPLEITDSVCSLLQQELVRPAYENQVALREHQRYVARLVRKMPEAGGYTVQQDQAYLITGGLGGLGLTVAQSLLEKGAQHLILLSRNVDTLSDTQQQKLAALQERGAKVELAQADVADYQHLQTLFAQWQQRGVTVAGIVHAAGISRDCPVAEMSYQDLELLFASKVKGTWNLHQLAPASVELWLHFSSIAAVWGSQGLSAYGAANHFLDAHATYLAAQSKQALSINWGPWSGVGMMDHQGEELLRKMGLQPLQAAEGKQALDTLLKATPGTVTVANVDWQTFIPVYAARSHQPLFDLLAPEKKPQPETVPSTELVARLQAVTAQERVELLRQYTVDKLALVLGGVPEDLDKGFFDLGLDSLMAVEFKEKLEEGLAVSLSPTLVFDCPTVTEVVEHLLYEVLALEKQQAAATPTVNVAVSEPIAIVGLSCRFPGHSDTPEAFWQLLKQGQDAVIPVPHQRWDLADIYDPSGQTPGTMYTCEGGFLERVDTFDPEFFGISPREAMSMDPQQRLLLEVTWEALERAGYAPELLHGSKTGVFVGIGNNDYGAFLHNFANREKDIYKLTGNTFNAAAGRISYTLGLQGPNIAVDTACSSSLVTVHMACQSLRLGECRMALASGVNLLVSPEPNIFLSSSNVLSPTGRCHTFDATADGYIRGEGCGVVVLKRLSDALEDRDTIYAVIRGSAVNHDGPSSGLTVPNGAAQRELLQTAIAQAGVTEEDVDYIEAHGTGTPLGDPVEMKALDQVYGKGHSQANPLMVGSVKTNLGHLEAAAGVAGLIKVVLALTHEEIPPHLHFTQPNPHIDWERLPIAVSKQLTAWHRREDKKRLAGISSFGISGTNAHLIVEEAPAMPPEATETTQEQAHILVLAGHKPEALAELCNKMGQFLKQTPHSLQAVCYSNNRARNHFAHRLAVVAPTRAELQEKLMAPDLQLSQVGGAPPKLVWLFTGQGSQYPAMGRELYHKEPVFREILDQCQELLAAELPYSLTDILYGQDSQRELIHQTRYTQPVLFAFEYALAKLWQSWGITPKIVLGHSVGEYVAACVAGYFSLEDGLKLISARAKLMQSLPQEGSMAAVFADESTVRAVLPEQGKIAIAALNSPRNTVISGQSELVEATLAKLQQQQIKSQKLQVSHAFHSPLMEPILQQFAEVVKQIQFAKPVLPLVSNLSGEIVTPEQMSDPDYWVKHIRAAVAFLPSIQTLAREGYHHFLEIGPSPTLLSLGKASYPQQAEARWLPSLQRGKGERERMLRSLAELYLAGHKIHWPEVGPPTNKVALPTYPFQRKRYWVSASKQTKKRVAQSRNPLVGSRVDSPLQVTQYAFVLDYHDPVLNDHKLHETVVVPGSYYTTLFLSAGKEHLPALPYCLENLVFPQAIVLPEGEESPTQLLVQPNKQSATVQIFSQHNQEWTLHAEGKMSHAQVSQSEPLDLDAIQQRCAQKMSGAEFYQRMWDKEYHLGANFTWIEQIWRHQDEALCQMRPSETPEEDFLIHPGLLDSCFQSLAAALQEDNSVSTTYVPLNIERLVFWKPPQGELWCHVRLHSPKAGAETFSANLLITDHEGIAVIEVHNLHVKRAGLALLGQRSLLKEWGYVLDWQQAERRAAQALPGNHCLLLGDEQGVAEKLQQLLQAKGIATTMVSQGQQWQKGANWQIDPEKPEHWQELLEAVPEELTVVYLWPLDQGRPTLKELSLFEIEKPATTWLAFLQAVLGAGKSLSKLLLVTRQAQATGYESNEIDLALAPLWGMARTVALEHPECHCVRFDLDHISLAEREASEIWQELQQSGKEDQVALRGHERYVARLEPFHQQDEDTWKLPDAQSYRLQAAPAGMIENLRLTAQTRPELAPGEVEIEVRATGLNFRDVLNVLGMLSGEKDPTLGGECAGVITRVGKEVSDWQVGDEVISFFAPGSFARYINASAQLLLRKPKSLSFAQAATVPAVFLTAHYALHHLGKMEPGTRVLIHAAAGGVGLAAVRIAQLAGAEIFATAGSQEKRDYLRALGIEHVMNSRDVEFAAQIQEMTQGQGVEIVLNSLAGGEFIPKSMSVLAPQGRFIEIGKAEILTPEKVAALRTDIDYHFFDIVDLYLQEPEKVFLIMDEIFQQLERGELRLLPFRTFAMENAKAAFRYMAQAKHIGKIVITQQSQEPKQISDSKTYLVTGGRGALGLLAAENLVELGARYLLLCSRGDLDSQQATRVEALREQGAEIAYLQVDIADYHQCQQLLLTMQEQDYPPVAGIFHTAGSLADAALLQQDVAHFNQVMSPKVEGTWNLYRLSQEAGWQLDFMMLYSSVASLLGSPGQSNYAAANAFMDAFAAWCQRQEHSALSVNWGPWAQAGMAANTKRSQSGLLDITPEKGSMVWQELLAVKQAQVGVLRVNWSQFFGQLPGETPAVLSRFSSLAEDREQQQLAVASIVAELAQLSPKKQRGFLAKHLQELTTRVLGLDPESSIDPNKPLQELGLDSLMAVELRNAIGQSLEKELPAILLFSYPTIEALVEYFMTEVLRPEEKAQAASGGQSQEPKQQQEEDLSDVDKDQLSELIDKELEGLDLDDLMGE